MTRIEFAKPYLVALYLMNREHSNIAANVGEIISRFMVPRDDYLEGELVEYMTHQGWVRANGGIVDPTAQMIITPNGKIHAESLIEQGIEAVDLSDWVGDDPIEESPDPAGQDIEAISIPAADRIVTLGHNAVGNLNGASTELIELVEGETSIDGDTSLRDRFVGQLKAGRELIREKTFSAYLLYQTLISLLGQLIEKYKGQAIGEAAKVLLALLIEHVFIG